MPWWNKLICKLVCLAFGCVREWPDMDTCAMCGKDMEGPYKWL